MMVLPPPPPKLKLVIRHLPPTLPQHLFWNTVEPWCGPLDQGGEEEEVTDHAEGSGEGIGRKKVLWRKWIQGRVVDENNLHQVFSRAYVLMTNIEDAIAFHKEFDGHAFRSKDGQEYRTLIELAPSQKVPPSIQSTLSALLKGTADAILDRKGKGKNKVRVDARQGTIDSDPDYLSFLESLNQPVTKPKPEDFVPPSTPQTNSTPLLDHLREIRIAKRALKDKVAIERRGTAAGDTYTRDERVKKSNGEERGKGRGKRGAGGPSGGGGGGGGGGIATGRQQPPSSPKGKSTPISNQVQQQKPIAILKREGGMMSVKNGIGPSVPPPNPISSVARQQGGSQSQQQHSRHPPPAQQRQNQQRPSQNLNPNARPPQQRQERPSRPPPSEGGRQGPGAALLSAAISASTGTMIGKGEDGKKKRVRTKKGRGEGGGQNVGDGGGAGGQGVGPRATVDPKEARIDA